MGIAVPGAIAAKRTLPERNVVGLVGDAGFLMNVQELATATQYGVAPTYLVWEDGGFGLIAWKQENHFGRHTDLSFGNPDFVMLAKSFGWNAYRCENSADLRATLEESFTTEGPSLVVIPIDYSENRKLTKRLGTISLPI